jgi:thioredoxin 1
MENVKTNFTNVKFENVDIDSQFEVAQKYFVRSVPTVIIEKNGKEVERFVGVQSEMTYTNALNENLS